MKKNWNWTKNDDQSAMRGNVPAQAQTAPNLPVSPTSYFGPLSSFYQDMDRVFDQAFRNFGLPIMFGSNGMQEMMFMPKVDISSTDNAYTIEVEVPGMDEEDIRLEVTRDGELCICGEKRLENDKQEKDFHRVERSYGSFSRTLSLPEDVDQENIEASFNNGVLTITAPRLEGQAAQPRRIEVNAGEGARSRRNQSGSARQDNAPITSTQPKRAA
jgi:HSP20 family protein